MPPLLPLGQEPPARDPNAPAPAPALPAAPPPRPVAPAPSPAPAPSAPQAFAPRIIKQRSAREQSWGTLASLIIIILMIVVGAFYAWGKKIAEERAFTEQLNAQTQ